MELSDLGASLEWVPSLLTLSPFRREEGVTRVGVHVWQERGPRVGKSVGVGVVAEEGEEEEDSALRQHGQEAPKEVNILVLQKSWHGRDVEFFTYFEEFPPLLLQRGYDVHNTHRIAGYTLPSMG